ncbi:hypothetical protein [Martelella sp. HB161492]|uniref:hypothetical protein n=1 Tax=Martelella sp. HB161492 TaxID=2720726 RepID=UPI0015902391|nr:hypothetical protein [Martelella sp. HB161492]
MQKLTSVSRPAGVETSPAPPCSVGQGEDGRRCNAGAVPVNSGTAAGAAEPGLGDILRHIPSFEKYLTTRDFAALMGASQQFSDPPTRSNEKRRNFETLYALAAEAEKLGSGYLGEIVLSALENADGSAHGRLSPREKARVLSQLSFQAEDPRDRVPGLMRRAWALADDIMGKTRQGLALEHSPYGGLVRGLQGRFYERDQAFRAELSAALTEALSGGARDDAALLAKHLHEAEGWFDEGFLSSCLEAASRFSGDQHREILQQVIIPQVRQRIRSGGNIPEDERERISRMIGEQGPQVQQDTIGRVFDTLVGLADIADRGINPRVLEQGLLFAFNIARTLPDPAKTAGLQLCAQRLAAFSSHIGNDGANVTFRTEMFEQLRREIGVNAEDDTQLRARNDALFAALGQFCPNAGWNGALNSLIMNEFLDAVTGQFMRPLSAIDPASFTSAFGHLMGAFPLMIRSALDFGQPLAPVLAPSCERVLGYIDASAEPYRSLGLDALARALPAGAAADPVVDQMRQFIEARMPGNPGGRCLSADAFFGENGQAADHADWVRLLKNVAGFIGDTHSRRGLDNLRAVFAAAPLEGDRPDVLTRAERLEILARIRPGCFYQEMNANPFDQDIKDGLFDEMLALSDDLNRPDCSGEPVQASPYQPLAGRLIERCGDTTVQPLFTGATQEAWSRFDRLHDRVLASRGDKGAALEALLTYLRPHERERTAMPRLNRQADSLADLSDACCRTVLPDFVRSLGHAEDRLGADMSPAWTAVMARVVRIEDDEQRDAMLRLMARRWSPTALPGLQQSRRLIDQNDFWLQEADRQSAPRRHDCLKQAARNISHLVGLYRREKQQLNRLVNDGTLAAADAVSRQKHSARQLEERYLDALDDIIKKAVEFKWAGDEAVMADLFDTVLAELDDRWCRTLSQSHPFSETGMRKILDRAITCLGPVTVANQSGAAYRARRALIRLLPVYVGACDKPQQGFDAFSQRLLQMVAGSVGPFRSALSLEILDQERARPAGRGAGSDGRMGFDRTIDTRAYVDAARALRGAAAGDAITSA